MSTMPPILAAQYVRMSTEHQQYSLDNQCLAIQAYADASRFSVVRTYVDKARSGLVLKRRDGLRQLLQDVVSGNPGYKAILVYDVSRWGRFQDADEGAHYEFLCKSAGIPVHYCTEAFVNDGTLPNVLLKAMKRSMAFEYSRELGVKTFAGQWNVYQRGFRGSGGCPGYGLRRMLVSPDGTRKQLLAPGERKGISNDRVILVSGPKVEVEVVLAIYRMFLEKEHSFSRIARELNVRNVPYRGKKRWDVHAVRKILTHPKYNGWLTYAKTSRKLHTKELKMPESEWLRVPHPSAKIIDDATCALVQRRLARLTINKSNDQLLDELRVILAANARLNSTIIRRTAGATSPASFRYRFGSLMRAYELIGYDVPVAKLVVTRRRIQDMRLGLMQRLEQMFPGEIAVRSKGGRTRSWLRLRNGTKVSVRVCLQVAHVATRPAWQLRAVRGESRWIALVVLMNRDNTQFEDFFVFKSVRDCGAYVRTDSPWLRQGNHLESLQMFCQVLNAVRVARKSRSRREFSETSGLLDS
jgi:DNA invertase Pin-like site-specific DNA recombinase